MFDLVYNAFTECPIALYIAENAKDFQYAPHFGEKRFSSANRYVTIILMNVFQNLRFPSVLRSIRKWEPLNKMEFEYDRVCVTEYFLFNPNVSYTNHDIQRDTNKQYTLSYNQRVEIINRYIFP